MLDSVTYPIVRRMLGYTNDDFFEKINPLDPFKVSPHMTLGVTVFKCAYYYLGMSMFNNVMRCMPMLHNSVTNSKSSCSIPIVNHNIVSLTMNGSPTLSCQSL